MSVTPARPALTTRNPVEQAMAWTKPEFCDIRFGFEITLYIANR
jgi:pyrroloquinoline quinone biosynthesis protein A